MVKIGKKGSSLAHLLEAHPAGGQHSTLALRRLGHHKDKKCMTIRNFTNQVGQIPFPVIQILFFLDYIENLIYFSFDPPVLLDRQGRYYYPHFTPRKLTAQSHIACKQWSWDMNLSL